MEPSAEKAIVGADGDIRRFGKRLQAVPEYRRTHALRHLQEQGIADLREAVLTGASERLAPILMTALAAGLALVPIAMGMGKPGSEIQAPMAIVIFCGLLSSTALNMVVVPAAYYLCRPRSVPT